MKPRLSEQLAKTTRRGKGGLLNGPFTADAKRLQDATLAALCSDFKSEAVLTLVDLMRHSKRDQVKAYASTRLIEWSEGVTDAQHPTVIVIDPSCVKAAAAEARRRRLGQCTEVLDQGIQITAEPTTEDDCE